MAHQKIETAITIADLEKVLTNQSSFKLLRKMNGSVVELVSEGRVMKAIRPDNVNWAELGIQPDAIAPRSGIIIQSLIAQAETATAQAAKSATQTQALTRQNAELQAQIKDLQAQIADLTTQIADLTAAAIPDAPPTAATPPPKSTSLLSNASLSLYAMNYIVAIIAVASIMTSLPNFLGFGISLPVFLLWHATIQFMRGSSPAEFAQVRGVFLFAVGVIGLCEVIFHWVGFYITLSDASVEVALNLFGVGKFGQSLFIALLFTFIQLTAIAINVQLKTAPPPPTQI